MSVRQYVIGLWQSWCKFWFQSADTTSISVFRLVITSTLFVSYGIRMLEMKLFFFNDGLMPVDLAKEYLPDHYRPDFYLYPTTDEMAVAMNVGLLLTLLLLALGVLGRGWAWLALFFHLALIQRNFTIAYGADTIASFWLFYLGFVRHNQRFSILNLWNKKRLSSRPVEGDILSTIGWRLIQVQLCVTYVHTGLDKLKGSSWWDGSAVWRVVGNTHLVSWDLSFFQYVPWLIAFLTYLTVLFEIYFPFAVWIPSLRRYWLALGVFFHFGVAVIMGLHFFSLVMVSGYLTFLKREEIDAALAWVKKRVRPNQVKSSSAAAA